MRLRPILVALSLGIPAISGAARAEGMRDAARAEALFKEGRRLMAAGDYAGACPKFADSQAIDPAPGTVLNLAKCYEKAGKLASAWAAFQTAQAAAQAARQPERFKIAAKGVASLEPRLSRLVIAVAPEAQVAGLEIRCDDEPVREPEWGVAIPRDGGGHDIEAKAPGRKTWRTHVELAAEEQRSSIDVPVLESEPPPPEAALAPTAASVNTPPSDTSPEHASSPPSSGMNVGKIVALSLGGLGVAGIGFGAYAGLTTSSTYNQAKRDCPGNPPTCDNKNNPGFGLRASADTWATATDIAFAAGGALLATGVVLYFALPNGRATSAAAITPVPGGATASIGGRF